MLLCFGQILKDDDKSVEMNQNLNWPYIPEHPYRILIIGASGSGKTNVLLSLIKNQRPDVDNIYLYVKDPFESKYQLLMSVWEKVVIKKLKNSKPFIDYSQTIDDVFWQFKIWKTIIQQRKGDY